MARNDERVLKARWIAKTILEESPNDRIKALATTQLSALNDFTGYEAPTEEDDRPSDPMPEDFEQGFTEPEFVVVKGVKYANKRKYRTAGGKFSGLVVHYTVSGSTASSARGVVSYLAKKNLGCMVMDADGKIYVPENFDIFTEWSSHAGTSKWGSLTSLSQYFAGMEICNWGKLDSKSKPRAKNIRKVAAKDNMIAGEYEAYTPAQEASLVNFILWAMARNPEFKLENIVGHDEIRAAAGRKGDKADPGGSLSMTMPAFRRLIAEKLKAMKAA